MLPNSIRPCWTPQRYASSKCSPGAANLMITVPGASGEARLVYICHMDTVTLGDGWNADTTVGFFTGCTDTAVIAGKMGNRNCMSYGPGSLVLTHKPNEPGAHADIVRCQNVLIALVDNTLWDASVQVGA